MDLRRRVRSLERRHADRLDQPLSHDPRRGDSTPPQQLRDWTERLHREQLTFQQIRETTRQVIAIMWNMAGDTERAMRVGSGLGNLDEEWDAAVQALTEDQIRGLCAICDAACLSPPAWPSGALPFNREIVGNISRQYLPHESQQREPHEQQHESESDPDQDGEPARLGLADSSSAVP